MQCVWGREGDTSLPSCLTYISTSWLIQDEKLALHSRLQHVPKRKLKRTLLLSLWTLSSIFFVSEPDVASSDATNMECQITREGSEVVINGRKWWSSGKWNLSLNYQFYQLYCFSRRAVNINHYGRKKTTAQKLSFECSQHRISFIDSKDRTTLYSIINNTTGKYCSVAFTWMVTLGFLPQTQKFKTPCTA